MRRPVIAGNWKMHKLSVDGMALASELRSTLSNVNHCDILVAPVFPYLKAISERLEGSNIRIAAQDAATSRNEGAFTGQVSAAMLKDVGCSHVILGHSERRQLCGETDEIVNSKIRSAIDSGLVPIVCIGEMLADREAGKQNDVVLSQMSGSLAGLTSTEAARIILAYEPVWAIGTGLTASPQQAQEMHGLIRRQIDKIFGRDAGDQVRILYGGSVKGDNIKALMRETDIDGALVGGASLDAVSFSSVVKYSD